MICKEHFLIRLPKQVHKETKLAWIKWKIVIRFGNR